MEIKKLLLRPETLLGIALPVAVLFAWPEGLSYQPFVFALAFAWLYLGPWPLDSSGPAVKSVVSPAMCRLAACLLGPLCLLLCLFAPMVGNFLLWLKIGYLLLFTSRMVLLLHHPPHNLVKIMWFSLWAMLAWFPVLWSPRQLDIQTLAYLAAMVVVWAAICGLLLGLIKKPAAYGLLLGFLHLGPLPPLALAWPNYACWVLLPLLILLALLHYSRGTSGRVPGRGEERGVLWLPLWLFRTVVLSWWCLGLALAVTLAWWLPGHDYYFEHNAWIKAICLGLFVLVCLGLLLEYLLPLMGRPEPEGHWRRDQSWGPMLSACAMLLLLLPALLLPEKQEPDFYFQDRAKAVLLEEEVALTAANQEISMNVPDDMPNIKHVYVISRLVHGQDIPQGQVVAVMAIKNDSGLPDVHYLRAGIDTADQDLGQSRVMALASHQPVEPADRIAAFSPDGQAYYQQSYISGFFLQNPAELLNEISLFYVPLESFAQQQTPCLVVEKVIVD